MPRRYEHDDLGRFLALTGPPSPRLVKLYFHLTALCRFATIGPSGPPRRTAVRCRKRPGRKPCPGLLDVRLRDLPSQVEWHCPVCEAAGRISSWESTDADLRKVVLERPIDTLRVSIPDEAHEALRAAALRDHGLIELAFTAEVDEDDRIWLHLPRDGVDVYISELLQHAMDARSARLAEGLTLLASHIHDACDLPSDGANTPFVEASAEASTTLRHALLSLADTEPAEFVPHPKRPRGPEATHPTATTYRVKVTLRRTKPAIWRRLLLPSDILLPDLHTVLQRAMGWQDAHLHMFEAGGRRLAPPAFELDFAEDSADVTLAELAPHEGDRVDYEYDFGDGWEHRLVVEQILPEPCEAPRCIKGRRACPPEDCGGPYGYAQLLRAAADPADVDDDVSPTGHLLSDPDEFDVMAADARVRAVPLRRRSADPR